MAAQAYGFRMFYLEAGSGAETPVSPELIKTARESCDLTLVVGGGIRDGETARMARRGRRRLGHNGKPRRGLR